MSGNKFSKDSLFTFLTSVFVFLLGFASLIIISRILGPKGKGIYSLIILIPGIITSFGNLGIGGANVYFTGSKKYKVKDIVGNSIFLSILMGLLAFLIFWFLTRLSFFQSFMEENKIVPFYLWVAVFMVPFSFLSTFLQGVIRGKEKINIYNIARLSEATIQLGGVFAFVYILKGGILGAVGGRVLAVFGLALFVFLVIKKMRAFSFKINRYLMKDSLFYGGKVYLADALSFLNYRLDMFLIAFFLSPVAVGIYSIAVGLSEKLFKVSGAFSIVLLPRVSSSKSKEGAADFSSKVARHTFFIFLVLSILLISLSYPLIFIFFGRDFLPAVLPLIVLMPGIIAFGLGGVLAADLSGRGKPQFAVLSSSVCLLINIPLNILLIPRWGIAGAALASSIGYWADTLVILIAFSRISRKKFKEILLIKKSDFQDYFRLLLAFREKIWKRS